MTPAIPTRRSFIQTAGAALSVPLAAAAGSTPVSAAGTDDPLARLARLEDVNAIRALGQEYARHVNAGGPEAIAVLFVNPSDAPIDSEVSGIAPDGFGEQDVIDIAPDRQTARALLHCTVQRAHAIGPDCPLVDMARQQGGGVVRRAERGVFDQTCVKRDGVWKIQGSVYRTIVSAAAL